MSLLAKALGLRRNEVITVDFRGDEIQVQRGGGEADDLVREVVLNGVQFVPAVDQFRLRPGSDARRLGVQVRIRQ